jgi:hypothetical protein
MWLISESAENEKIQFAIVVLLTLAGGSKDFLF